MQENQANLPAQFQFHKTLNDMYDTGLHNWLKNPRELGLNIQMYCLANSLVLFSQSSILPF